MDLCQAYMDVWGYYLDWIFCDGVYITLFCLFVSLWCFPSPFWCWSFWPPLGVFITWGYYLTLSNPTSLLLCAFLVRHWRYLLLGEILFAKGTQWPHEPLDSDRFIGEEVLLKSCPSYLWLAAFYGTVVTRRQKRRIDKSLAMTIQHLYYLILDLCNSLWSQCNKHVQAVV